MQPSQPPRRQPTRAVAAHHRARAAAVWEYRVVQAPRELSRADLRQLLTELAEYEGWNVHTVRLYEGGRRKVRLRRKVIRQRRPQTLLGPPA
ncbi:MULTISPECIES: DUF5703 family protein [Kytococcus]|uniref:DUF5703 family protein n=1 Tax=Kytococcus TaxID=57499 RepID=UPI001EDA40D8|nr:MULTISPECIES: DUF5703 family protein [Kytococcus]